ncbi:hypothetical protein C8R45DRAFT_937198 [Mycena sanguinolenta]|nr:hypothetical protein C8R45DRAFT_937198 [Mycena sanguinolenta]
MSKILQKYSGTMLGQIWSDGKKSLKLLDRSFVVQYRDSTKCTQSGLHLLMTYVSKVASIYEQMEKNMQQQFEKIGGTWPKIGVSLAQHIKSECPDPSIDWTADVELDD